MLWTIDIGNSRVKAGRFVHENFPGTDKLSEVHIFDDLSDTLSFLKTVSAEDTAISSVVPDKTKIISGAIRKMTGKNPFIISNNIKTNLEITYKTPESLGNDRLCSAEGAFYLFKNSEKFKTYREGIFILSADFGTATTINIIGYPGKFSGGLIAPGIEMMFESLKMGTAQLPHPGISDFSGIIGIDTKSSIASGVLTSVTGMIEKTLHHLHERNLKQTGHPAELIVYVTGGNAEKIIPFFHMDFVYEKGLVMYGINALYRINNI